MDDPYKVIEAVKCETAYNLLTELYAMCKNDPRGEDVGQAMAVAIDYKYVRIELREYEDGTRKFALSGV